MTEDQLLSKCFTWLWNFHPEMRYCFWHVPNELSKLPCETKKQFMIRIQQAKAKGVLPGVHDLHLFWKKKFYTFELKSESGIVSKAQERFWKAVSDQGAKCFEILDLNSFVLAINVITTEK